jgi:DNA repair and recombination protein RAD52
MGITEEQHKELNKPLASDYIKQRKGGSSEKLSYVEGWYCIHRANEIFGFDGWSHEILELTMVFDRVVDKQKQNGEKYKQCQVLVRARVRVTALGVSKDDIGLCIGTASEVNAPDAHDMAWKGAVTDAMKRALRQFGNQFGNALYDKDKEFVGPSSDAQTLLEDAKTLADNDLEAINAWIEQNGDLVDALHQDERSMVWGVVNAKHAKAKLVAVEASIKTAANMGQLGQIYNGLPEWNFDRATHDRLVTACQARKAQLGKAAA